MGIPAYMKGKSKGGQPMKYQTVEELESAIDAYFKQAEKNDDPVTLSGLAVALGVDRKTILNYSKNELYFPTIKKARQIIEAYAEQQLYKNPRTAGVIFSMVNNFGWENKQTNKHEGKLSLANILSDETNATHSEDSD